jgi:Predicted pPIWI-associating nuclease
MVRDLLYSGQSISSIIGTASSLSGALIQRDAARSAFVTATLGGIAGLPHETWESLIRLPRIEALALTHLEVTKLDRLADFFAPLDSARAELRASLEGLTGSFAKLTGFLPRIEAPGKLPSVLARRSTADVLFASHLAATVTTDDSAELAEELSSEVRDVAADEGDVRELLGRLDAGLVALLDGADEARKSSNPDRVRHATTSLRELITHVLHRLAPDDDVKAWSSDPNHFDKGHPTRAARLLYIQRAINAAPLDDFIRADVGCTVRFIGLFQEGTHAVRSGITELQLRAMQIRTEELLRLLLTLGENSSN